MFKLSDYVDVATIFRTLDELPQDIGAARHKLWNAEMERGDATRVLEDAQRTTLANAAAGYAECKNAEQREQFKWELFANDEYVQNARGVLDKADQDIAQAKAVLANLDTTFSAIRNTIRLLQVVTDQNIVEASDIADRLKQDLEEMDDEIPF